MMNWPLAVSSFTLWDKIVIAKWLLTEDRYTMGAKVEELEVKMSEFAGARALMVSSGSTANQMVFELWKIKNPGKKALVICPAVTWVSSITPAIHAGMDIVFCDINLQDFSFDYIMLDRLLKENAGRDIIIWPTALIGFSPDMPRLRAFAKQYDADLFLDSCENTFSTGVLSSCDITTTSGYFSHQIVSVEGGFCFFKSEDDFKLAKMFRNHGMSRSLATDDIVRRVIERENPGVDPAFLFALPGTNLRPTDVHAMFGLRDFKRASKSKAHREEIYAAFAQVINPMKYTVPTHPNHSAFCLPLFRRDESIGKVKALLRNNGVETRPIIGGNLLRQPIFNHYGNPADYPNAEWVNNHGCYVGLHNKVSIDMVNDLAKLLNSI